MKEIRIAIIGTGMISHRHMTVINNLKKQGQALTVVAAAEIDRQTGSIRKTVWYPGREPVPGFS